MQSEFRWRVLYTSPYQVEELEEALFKLMSLFEEENGVLPDHVVVYRDGVSDSQFQQVLDNEVPAIKGSVNNVF